MKIVEIDKEKLVSIIRYIDRYERINSEDAYFVKTILQLFLLSIRGKK